MTTSRLSKPSVTKLSPASGCASGGYKVTIYGAEMGNTVNVEFGPNLADDVDAQDTVVTCIAPAGPIGQIQLTCVDKYGNRSNTLPFLYEDC